MEKKLKTQYEFLAKNNKKYFLEIIIGNESYGFYVSVYCNRKGWKYSKDLAHGDLYMKERVFFLDEMDTESYGLNGIGLGKATIKAVCSFCLQLLDEFVFVLQPKQLTGSDDFYKSMGFRELSRSHKLSKKRKQEILACMWSENDWAFYKIIKKTPPQK